MASKSIKLKPAVKISVIYVLFGITWIFLSDRFLYLFFSFKDPRSHIIFQNLKGTFYVLLTGYLLYVLIKSFYRRGETRLEELEARQEELGALQRLTKTGNWEYDVVLRQMGWSPVVADILEMEEGYKAEDYLVLQHLKHPEEKEIFFKVLDDAEKIGLSFDFEVEIITAKGNEKFIRLAGKPFMSNGKCIKIFGSYQDITQSKATDKKIRQLSRLNSFIMEVNKAIVSTTSRQQLFADVCDIAVRVGKFQMAWIGTVDDSTGTILPAANAGHQSEYFFRENPAIPCSHFMSFNGDTSAEEVKKYFVSNDIESEALPDGWKDVRLSLGYRSLLAVPVITFGKLTGLFTMYSSVINFFDESEIELLLDATADVSHALENMEKETQRTYAELRLAESEAQYRLIVETASEGIVITDESGCISFANSRMAAMLGYENTEIAGRYIFDFMDEVGKTKMLENIHLKAYHITELHDFKFFRKDGNFIWAQLNLSPMQSEGKYKGALAMITDITSRKKAESNVLDALERYDILSEATSDTIWDWDLEKDHILYNKGMVNVFGYPIHQIGNTAEWRETHIHKNNKTLIAGLFADVFANRQEVIQSNYRFQCADGSYKYVSDRAYIKYNKHNKPIRVIGTMQDVTHEVELETRIEKAVINMQEQERQQFGMELHDNVNQILAASLLFIGLIKEGNDKHQDVSVMFSKTEQYIKDAIDEVRRLSHELAPVSFKDIPITQVFTTLLDTLHTHKLFEVNLQVDTDVEDQLPVDLKINLYRILQEQLNNIIKYACASKVLISLAITEGIIKMQVKDNGKGFDTSKKSNGIGLENIRRRSKLFYGSFKLISAPGNGCEILVEIPLNAE